MPFECIDCKQETLSIIASIEIPPDNRSDDISLQLLKCSSCGFSGLAVYEESRRGNLMDDCWNHDGFRIAPNDFEQCLAWILSCPDPQNTNCDCPIHRILNKRDPSGQWIGLEIFDHHDPFLLQQKSS